VGKLDNLNHCVSGKLTCEIEEVCSRQEQTMSDLIVLNLLIVERRPKENWFFIKHKEDSERRCEVGKIRGSSSCIGRY
jgi:hypothetical protein